MYRRSIRQKEKMEAEESQLQFLIRMGQLPVVSSTMEQLGHLYTRTKESNSLVRMTLQTAESGVKVISVSAQPVITKLEKPIGAIDNIACNQLDKLQDKYPVIAKPTDQVMKETKDLYNATLKPTVDRVTAVTQYGVTGCKNATQFGADKYNGIKNYGVEKVQGVGRYTTDTLGGMKDYGVAKVGDAANSHYGQLALCKVDSLLDVTEDWIDHYLPPLPEEEGDKPEKEGTPNQQQQQQNTLTHTIRVTDKMRRRVTTRAVRQVQNAQRRSKESLEKLHFTVDLMQYARENIDGVQERLANVPTKVKDIWTQINMTEAEAESENIDPEKTDVQKETLERRLIVTARHLSQKVKRSLTTLSEHSAVLPTVLRNSVNEALKISMDLYNLFSSTDGKMEGVTNTVLAQSRTYVSTLMEMVNNMGTFLTTAAPLHWLAVGGEHKPDPEEERDATTPPPTAQQDDE